MRTWSMRESDLWRAFRCNCCLSAPPRRYLVLTSHSYRGTPLICPDKDHVRYGVQDPRIPRSRASTLASWNRSELVKDVI